MRRKNIIAAAILMAFAVLYGAFTAFLPERTLPNTPAPAFFPWINTAVILVLSIWLLVRGLRQQATGTLPYDRSRRRKATWAMGALIIYVAAMPSLGFILSTAPFFAIMMVFFGEHRPVWILAGSLCATIVLYVVFRHGFGVFLPRGLLEGFVT